MYPVAVWWQNLNNIERWVTQLGVNVLIYQNAISFQKGDFVKLHQMVGALRQRGYPLYVVRSPAYKFANDAMSVDFDKQCLADGSLMAFALDDEFEDKVPNTNNVWGNQQPIIDYCKAEIAAYKKWLPNVPIWANFNGTHISDPATDGGRSKTLYTALANCGIDILCSDNYPICNQQYKPDGTLLYADPIASIANGTKWLKAWTNKPVWTYIETCNQDIHKANDNGWADPWKFKGSRCPTPDEENKSVDAIVALHGDGLAYFPQAHWGGVNDATPESLYSTLAAIGSRLNPKARKAVSLTITYDDGSTQKIAL